jgi:hypothetical protein
VADRDLQSSAIRGQRADAGYIGQRGCIGERDYFGERGDIGERGYIGERGDIGERLGSCGFPLYCIFDFGLDFLFDSTFDSFDFPVD